MSGGDATPKAPVFENPRHQYLSTFFTTAQRTGKLGPGRAENPHQNIFKALIQTFPLTLMLVQLIWSGVITIAAYFVSDTLVFYYDGTSKPELTGFTLSEVFWKSRLNVSPSVTSGVGWALFVLLGFYIKAASTRYIEAQKSIYRAGRLLLRAVRVTRQAFPQGSWHPGDRDRIIAHLMAYPLAFKMALRGERDEELLKTVLHPADARDVINARSMQFHCMRVVKSYFVVADDANPNFKHLTTMEKTEPGVLTRMAIGVLTDGVDEAAIGAFRISQFRPSAGYINHLKVFLLIWMMFVPLTIIHTSGWFTVLWSLLITYAVAMLLTLAESLDSPFGFDEQDIKLNTMAAKMAHDVLVSGYATALEYNDVIDEEHETPAWLEESLQRDESDYHIERNGLKYGPGESMVTSSFSVGSSFKKFRFRGGVYFSLAAFLIWSAFIVMLTWGLRWDHDDPQVKASIRWWTVYIPLTDKTSSYLSLALSTLLGFWLNDAYARYWRALQLWQTQLQPMVVQYAYHFAVCAKNGHWHHRDRERILSHITALPYALMLQLRDSRDVSILSGILSAKDLTALQSAPHLTSHILDVLYAYLRISDARQFRGTPRFKVPLSIEPNNYPRLEDLIIECESVKMFVIAPVFTLHLIVMCGLFLATLPVTLIHTSGWVSFLFLIPIGYSYIKLISVGHELSDPFGDDKDDLDLEDFCNRIKESIITTYRETASPADARHYIRASSTYDRAALTPHRQPADAPHPDASDYHITFKVVMEKIQSVFPSVPPGAFAVCVVWAVASVFISWGFSHLWPDAKRFQAQGCVRWCSPLDVPPKTLGNIGYALFLILAFRASDALSRYDDGTAAFTELKMMLRTTAVEGVQFMADGSIHDGDKERLVAHLAHIPLLFCDLLLRRRELSNGGFLSPEDRKLFEASEDPMSYLIKTVEAYFLWPDIKGVGSDGQELRVRPKPPASQLTFNGSMRMGRVRQLFAKILTVKGFPVVRSYKKHQRLFSIVWLAMLPFALTPKAGFFTILWVVVISYAVLVLEDLAMRLVDPYGEDEGDLPIKSLCEEASAVVIDAAHSIDWGLDKLVKESLVDHDERIGVLVHGNQAYHKYTVASTRQLDGTGASSGTASDDADQQATAFDDDGIVRFSAPREARVRPTLYAHFMKSVPWGVLALSTVWTVFAIVVSFVSRDTDLDKIRWWRSQISITTNVAKYISTGTLALLGFYVRSAFGRYNSAARFWGDDLQSYLHNLVTAYLYLFPAGEVHRGDQRRIIGHIAALPLVLKHELRHSRDIRELKGLLSSEDMAKLLIAPSMSAACVDVIRAYFYKIIGRPETLTSDKIKPGFGFIPIWIEVKALESAVENVKRLNVFDIAPLFLSTLKGLLVIWFIIVPFALAEFTGWLTILWVGIISYGIIGMYSVAEELQHPFGNDINDLDLDALADDIVTDLLQVYRLRKRGEMGVVKTPDMDSTLWKEPGLPVEKSIFSAQDEMSITDSIKQTIQLTMNPVPLWMLIATAGWSALSIYLSWIVSLHLPQPNAQSTTCSLWWCSAIAIDKNVKEYLGFALFLLLGFRLSDSHGRYVKALQCWQDKIIGQSRMLAERLFGSHGSSSWNAGGREYVAGHLAAYSQCLVGALRGDDRSEKLRRLVSDEDVKKIMRMRRTADYCMDVVIDYILAGEKKIGKDPGVACSRLELMTLLITWRKLGLTANDCQVVKTIPMPYGYVVHLRIFLLIWLALLPLGIVEANGWIGVLWVTIIAYGVIGVERWAEELSDPYDEEISSVPLEPLGEVAINAVKNEFDEYQDGIAKFIRADRPPYPDPANVNTGSSSSTMERPSEKDGIEVFSKVV